MTASLALSSSNHSSCCTSDQSSSASHEDDDDDDDCRSLHSTNSSFSLRDRGLQMWGRISSSIRGDEESFRSEAFRVHPSDPHNAAAEQRRLASLRAQADLDRRLAQFKRDEAFVMQRMNERLERDVKAAARRRLSKENREAQVLARTQQHEAAVQARAKQVAVSRNSKQQEKLRRFLVNSSDASSGSPITAKSVRRDSWASVQKTHVQLQEQVMDSSGKTVELSSSSSEESHDEAHPADSKEDSCDDDSDDDDDYQKTIRWCPTVNDELERRAIHRRTNPTKPGGIARRVRRLPKETLSAEEVREHQMEDEIQGMIAQYRQSMLEQSAQALEEELSHCCDSVDDDTNDCDDNNNNVWSELVENSTLTSTDTMVVSSPTSVAAL